MLAEDRAEEVEDGKSVFETGSLKSLSMKKRTRASSSTLVLQPLSETLPRRKVVVLGDGAIGKTSLLGVLCGLPVSPVSQSCKLHPCATSHHLKGMCRNTRQQSLIISLLHIKLMENYMR